MQYRTFAPADPLKPFIKYFWMAEGDEEDSSQKTFSAIPDGCPGIIMMRSEREALRMDDDKKLPGIFLYGQTVAPASFSSNGKMSAIGICFQPHSLQSIFGLEAGELTNSCVDLRLIAGDKKNSLPEQLLNASTTAVQIGILSSYVFDRQRQNKRHADEITKYAISQLTQSKGTIPMKELQQRVQLSERSLERKFKSSVGISPKLFSRIIRFQDSLHRMRSNDYDKLSDIAYENDYADQAHFTRVFKEFTGFTPLEFKRQSHEVVENFPEIVR